MDSQGVEDQQTFQRGTNSSTITRENQRVLAANNIFQRRKVFNDPIHGHIEMHPVCVRIIDTPQFQRLRHIKQLDTCYLVYPGASHNRFEHSLGTCFLAGKLLRTIMERQPDEAITERDILCVEIAGLCHDLGQGPFSHVFEKKFMPRMDKEFTHEATAKKMFEFMLEDNGGELKQDIQTIIRECHIPDFEEFEDNDFVFISEMIDKPKDLEGEEWPYSGREQTKSFMYEIVANKRTGIDVDKWDYLARDSYMLGMKVNFDHNRCFMSARVLLSNGIYERNGTNRTTEVNSRHNESNGTNESNETTNSDGTNENSERNGTTPRKQICYRDKDTQNLYDMFYTRMTLHRRAYQHKTHKIIGMMICDALIAANDAVKFVGKDGNKYRISDTVDDMQAYTQLTDDVFQIILYSPASSDVLHFSDIGPKKSDSTEDEIKKKENFIKAKTILKNIVKRNLYKCVLQMQFKKFDEKMFKEKVMRPIKPVKESVFDYDVVCLDYGMKDRDPMAKVGFYSKDNYDKPIKLKREQVSYILPDTFEEHSVRVYCKSTDIDGECQQHISELKKKCESWRKQEGVQIYQELKGTQKQACQNPALFLLPKRVRIKQGFGGTQTSDRQNNHRTETDGLAAPERNTQETTARSELNNQSTDEEHQEQSNNQSTDEEHPEQSNNQSTDEEHPEQSNNQSTDEEHPEQSNNQSTDEEHPEQSNNQSTDEEHPGQSNNQSTDEEHPEQSNNQSTDEEHPEQSNNQSTDEEHPEQSNNQSTDEEHPGQSNNQSTDEEHPEQSNNQSTDEEHPGQSNNQSTDEEHPGQSNNQSTDEEHPEQSNNQSTDEEHPEQSNNQSTDEEHPEQSNNQSTDEEHPEQSNNQSTDEEHPGQSNNQSTDEEHPGQLYNQSTDEKYKEQSNNQSTDEIHPRHMHTDSAEEEKTQSDCMKGVQLRLRQSRR